MKRWEKYQTRIANAKTAREFIVRVFNCTMTRDTVCALQRLDDKCDTKNIKKCEECILNWCNAEIEEGE